eukprot:5060011-Alexandrium_andersonii.AAC.1
MKMLSSDPSGARSPAAGLKALSGLGGRKPELPKPSPSELLLLAKTLGGTGLVALGRAGAGIAGGGDAVAAGALIAGTGVVAG